MPYNGNGIFSRIYQWVNDAANDIDVDATRTDTDSNDIADGLSNCMTRDGQSPAVANIPLGGNKIIDLANGTSTTDAVTYDQVFNSPTFVGPKAQASPAAGDNSTLLATTAFLNSFFVSIAGLTEIINTIGLTATLPDQAGKAGQFLTTDGVNGSFAPIDGRGSPLVALGNSGTAAQALSYSSTAEGWSLTVTGIFNLTAFGFPVGRISGGLLNLTNGGAFAWTSTGITWKKSDGTESTTLAGAGYALKSAGKDQIALYSFGDGTIYGKLV